MKYPAFSTPEDAVKHYKLKERAGYDLAPLQLEDLKRAACWDRVKWFYDVGVGKTVCSTVHAWMGGHQVHLVLVPPVLITQWGKWLRRVDPDCTVLEYRGTPAQRKAMKLVGPKWIIMSYAIFRGDFDRIFRELGREHPHLIVDECFPAGTPVLTPGGEVQIEKLRVGDLVLTSAGPRPVQHVFNKVASSLLTLELSDGRRIRCTPNHPVFTDLGWLAAEDCEGRWVLSVDDLSDVREGVQQASELAHLGRAAGQPDGDGLFQTLRDETEGCADTRGVCLDGGETTRGARHGEKSEGVSTRTPLGRSPGSSVQGAEGQGAQASGKGWQRHGDDACGSLVGAVPGEPRVPVEPVNRAGQGLSSGWLPSSLQGGLWLPGAQAGAGGGRPEPQASGQAGAGPEKGGTAQGTRVVRVSCSQRGGAYPVFNLEVAGCPHYFAGGVLVHNCHHAKNSTSQLFRRINTLSTGGTIQLLTGTPTSKPTDAYAYIKLTTPTRYRSLGQFENLHVASRDFFGNITAYQALDMVKMALMDMACKRTKEEMFPGIVKARYQVLDYELEPKHLKLYNELAEEQLLLLGNGEKIDATQASTLYHALQQIVVNLDHFSGDEDARSAAYDLIDQTIDETQCMDPARSKLIIWTYYKRTSASILHYLEDFGAVGAYSGANSVKSVDRFLNDPKCRILVAQPMSAGFGLEPQHVCWENLFIEHSTVPLHFAQSVGRTDRKGQMHMPTMRVAVAQNTIQVPLHSRLLHNGDLVKQTEGNLASIRDAIYGKN